MPKRGVKQDSVMCISIDRESKQALKEFCEMNGIDSLSLCVRRILKIYFKLLLARKKRAPSLQ